MQNNSYKNEFDLHGNEPANVIPLNQATRFSRFRSTTVGVQRDVKASLHTQKNKNFEKRKTVNEEFKITDLEYQYHWSNHEAAEKEMTLARNEISHSQEN